MRSGAPCANFHKRTPRKAAQFHQLSQRHFLERWHDLRLPFIASRVGVLRIDTLLRGIEVAKLAGLPNEVVVRAREVLAEHESFRAPAFGPSDAGQFHRAGTSYAVDHLHAAIAAGAGEVTRGGFKPANAARSVKLAGGAEERNLTAETRSTPRNTAKSQWQPKEKSHVGAKDEKQY